MQLVTVFHYRSVVWNCQLHFAYTLSEKLTGNARPVCGEPKDFNQEPNLIVRNDHFLYDIISNSTPYL